MTEISKAISAVSPTPKKVMNDSATFSPRRWKTGWPHHLRRVPPFRDDVTAKLTRAEVFLFAQDVVESEYNRDQIIDFLGAVLAYGAGQSKAVLPLQQFLRNKGKAHGLIQAIRQLPGKSPAEQYAALTATGLPAKFASQIAYFLAGPQEPGDDKPLIICSNRARVAGLDSETDWSAEEYAEYLARVREARDAADEQLPLDAVEWAMREYVKQQG
ncbi:hypothetical protein [Corynebacterium sp.]|uniref:8-oxoguanine DNA glycosylase OGG fold protein n=1 Tax=Corynebacterium sp. TaxID=1720 RepID=UPI0026DABA98|nr:hypothetical protein [Corynebacterium sp.]MDO5031024.1 hypothetical protein [Corynebacterium sp.]